MLPFIRRWCAGQWSSPILAGGARDAPSGRLQRPRDRSGRWRCPNQLAGVLAVAVALAFIPGALGHAAAVAAGAFAAAMALVGLAVLHALTAGMAGRAAILATTYALVFLSGFPIVLFAALGVGEGFFHLRERRFGGGRRALNRVHFERSKYPWTSSCLNASPASDRWATSSASATATRATSCFRRARR